MLERGRGRDAEVCLCACARMYVTFDGVECVWEDPFCWASESAYQDDRVIEGREEYLKKGDNQAFLGHCPVLVVIALQRPPCTGQ